jgi:hypothetical protein
MGLDWIVSCGRELVGKFPELLPTLFNRLSATGRKRGLRSSRGCVGLLR